MNNAEAYMVKVTRLCQVPSGQATSPGAAHAYWKNVIAAQPWFDADKEHLIALLLNADGNVEGFSLISIGSLTETVAYPREIFRAAVAQCAFAVVLMHNHPGDSVDPSEADIHVTARLQSCGDLLGIGLLDHIIVANNGGAYSFKENGRL